MSRVIKFRAWHKQNKKMDEVTELCTWRHLVYVATEQVSWTFDEIELMQFTGLLDSTNGEIYEGDIIEIEGATAKVVFWERPPEFGLDALDEDAWCDDWNLSDESHRMTIIGNLYERPHLLK